MYISIKMLIAMLVIAFALAAGSFVWVRNGVSGPQERLANVAGHLPDLQFNLVSDTGEHVTQDNYQGRVTILFFGFTSCPDECPATMMRLTSVLKKLGNDAENVHVVFITVDPGTDTPHVLKNYMKNFDAAHMTGLTGSSDQIEALAQRYRAAYQACGTSGKEEDIVHSDAIYIFDAKGHAQLLATPTDTDENLVHDLRKLTEAMAAR